jgi:hypothetical protein
MGQLKMLETGGAVATERDAVLLALTQAARNIPFFVLLAIIVSFLPGWLGLPFGGGFASGGAPASKWLNSL